MTDPDDSAGVPRDRGEIRLRDYVRFDPQILVGLLPVAVFLIANALGPAQIAMAFRSPCRAWCSREAADAAPCGS